MMSFTTKYRLTCRARGPRRQCVRNRTRFRSHWQARGQGRECISCKRPTQLSAPNFRTPDISLHTFGARRLWLRNCKKIHNVLGGCDQTKKNSQPASASIGACSQWSGFRNLPGMPIMCRMMSPSCEAEHLSKKIVLQLFAQQELLNEMSEGKKEREGEGKGCSLFWKLFLLANMQHIFSVLERIEIDRTFPSSNQ